MKAVRDWLLANGLTNTVQENTYENDNCQVTIYDDYYEVYFNKEEGTVYSTDLQIYWLIGILTYYNLIDRNYISLY